MDNTVLEVSPSAGRHSFADAFHNAAVEGAGALPVVARLAQRRLQSGAGNDWAAFTDSPAIRRRVRT
jgi:hypothetical protein